MTEHHKSETIVIKIGTSSLLHQTIKEDKTLQTDLNIKQIAAVVETVATLTRLGHRCVIVSSGACGTGCHRLNMTEKPSELSGLQALPAVGQVLLMSKYENFFAEYEMNCGQILLTYDAFRHKKQYHNAGNTFRELFNMGVVPIVNENDTVATEELKSENDTLAAMIASLVKADRLFLLTDVDGLYTSNPNTDPDAKLIEYVDDPNDLESLCNTGGKAQGGSTFGTGGMFVKINAARLAASLGIETTIMSAEKIGNISDMVLHGNQHGTTFAKSRKHPEKRKRWIRSLRTKGSVILDTGAVEALKHRKNIFAVGILDIVGKFPMKASVRMMDTDGNELGAGLASYSSEDLRKVMGKDREEMEKMDVGVEGAVLKSKNMVVNFPRSAIDSKWAGTSNDDFSSVSGQKSEGSN